MSKQTKLKNEKDLTGFYITGHPLDGYKNQLKKLLHISKLTEDPDSFDDGQTVVVAGIISKMEIKVTKKGDTMAILRLEDMTGHIEVVIFPKTYTEYMGILMEDAIIKVDGRFSFDDRGNKILASNISTLREDIDEPTLNKYNNWKKRGR